MNYLKPHEISILDTNLEAQFQEMQTKNFLTFFSFAFFFSY